MSLESTIENTKILTSSDLNVKGFKYLKILEFFKNDEDVIRFSGVPDSEIEQELIYHRGGDSFQVNGLELYGYENDYIVRWNSGECELVRAHSINFITESKTKNKDISWQSEFSSPEAMFDELLRLRSQHEL